MYAWLTRLRDSPPLCQSVCAVAVSRAELSRAERCPCLPTYTALLLLLLCLGLCSLPLSHSITLWLCRLLFSEFIACLTLVVCCFYHFTLATRCSRLDRDALLYATTYTALSPSAQLCAKQILLACIRAWVLLDDFASIRHFSLKRHVETAFASVLIGLYLFKLCNMSNILYLK